MNELQDIDLKELIEKETGERFNRQGYINCPFHKDKTPSLRVRFNSNKNKDFFKCFGCTAAGDAIDFIMQFKNLKYLNAREYLGLENKKSEKELLEDKVRDYIQWQIEKQKDRNWKELLGLFTFVDKNNQVLYWKAKLLKKDGKKDITYYHIEDTKVVNKRGHDEVPYNLYNTIKAINNEDVIIFVEGEKDANTINSLFKGKGYVASSIKGCKDLEYLKAFTKRIYVIGDTGQAGEQYKWHVWDLFKGTCSEFRFVNLPGLKALGDNKDVTDWLEAGHTKYDLLKAFSRSLDLKNKFELQQDNGGIYKHYYNKKTEEYERAYLTDFKIIEATRMSFIDEEQEGIKLKFKSSNGDYFEKVGSTVVFDDLRSFRNFLGSMALTFKSKNIEDLILLKIWVNNYFALENEEIYNGVQFREKDGKLYLICNEGAISNEGILPNMKSDERNEANIFNADNISKEEMKKLKRHLFRFASPDKTLSIIGSVINNFTSYHSQATKMKMHHLLIVGESGSGKSTILENVIAPILNYPKKEIKSLGLATNFTLIKDLSDGNYPMLYEEHKPSRWDRYKIAKLSEVLRNLYERTTVARGDKALKSKNFQLARPIIIVGEENYHNSEKALIERSCIIYISKDERTEENTEAMEWLIENGVLLNKLGRSLVNTVLNMSIEDYRALRKALKENIKGLKDRPLNTAINICMGIELLNILLKNLELLPIKDYLPHVIKNIESEILEDGRESHSVVEQMLCLYNDMIEDGRALQAEEIVKFRGDGIFIKTTEMLNQINEHINRFGADIMPLSLKDFRKQAKKSKYILGISDKLIKLNSKPVRFDTYNADKLRELKVNSIIPPEMTLDNEDKEKIIKMFEGA